MLAYDVIGFQTEEWLESFHHYVERELGGHCEPGRHDRMSATARSRPRAYPIGIDAAEFARRSPSPTGAQGLRDGCDRSADGRH